MTTKKVLTAKKQLPCLLIWNKERTVIPYAVVRRTDGTFGIHDSTNYIDPFDEKSIKDYHKSLIEKWQQNVSFDEQPFIEAFNKYQEEKEAARLRKEQESREAEEKRIAELRGRIEGCETPIELVKEFGLRWVETAHHWSDLYEGRSSHAILVSNREEKEIVDLAIEIHDAEGDWGEARNRAGEHHWTFSNAYMPELSDYQKALDGHFSGDHYFYRSQKTEAEVYNENITEIMEDDSLTAIDKIEKIKKLLKEYDELEAGYYDCNGNLEMSEKDLNDPDLTGYSEDVYEYNYGFRLDHNYDWKEQVDEEIEEDEE